MQYTEVSQDLETKAMITTKQIKTYFCGCVRNCAKYIPAVINNIEKLAKQFDDYHIVVAYDMSTDQSLHELCTAKRRLTKMDILINRNPLSVVRTQNIANARNTILEFIRTDRLDNSTRSDFEYFFMIDFDDVCAGTMNMNALNTYLEKERDGCPCPWDALSFNRPKYYDIWALSIHPFMYNCWGFPNGGAVVDIMRNYVQKKLQDVLKNKEIAEDKEPVCGCELLNCASAFNGFAVYRLDKFIDISYEWTTTKNMELITPDQVQIMAAIVGQPVGQRMHDEDCEHRYFHMKATHVNGARICISPYILFTEMVTSH